PAGGGEVPERIASKSGEMAVDASSGRNGVAGKPSLEATRGRAPNVPDTPLRAMGKVPEGAGRTKFGAAGETARRQQGEEVRLMKKAETSRHASGVTIQVANIGTATVEEILQKYGATRCEQAEAAEEGLVAASQRQKLVKANREVEEIWVACPARNLDVFLADLTRLGAAVTTGPEMPTVSTLPQTAVGESSATAGGNTGVVFVRILLTGQNPKK
ncbi:MAG: hypothetical protein N2255_09285, partial [Kiritimatiellae bacterium]|nr:hypothetical protein [Kiritimatiellia bacterium]